MKIKSFTVIAAAAALALTGCSDGVTPAADYKVYMPDGAPAVALSKLMSEGYDGASFTVVKAENIGLAVSQGKADFAIMPVNAAANLYNKGVNIVMLSVNTHGNLYVLGAGDEIGINDLVGKKLGSIGQSGVPEYTLRMLLSEEGAEYTVSETAVDGKVAVQYVTETTPITTMVADYKLVAEPQATALSAKLGLNIVLDIQKAWKDAFGGDYPQACLVVKGSVLESDKTFVDKFVAAVKDSDGWAESNPEKAVEAVKAHMDTGIQSTLTTLSGAQIKGCNIKTVSATDAKSDCATYFEKLTHIETGSATGATALAKVPGDGFYYSGE